MSVDQKVLTYIKDNPGATPREIADALGLPLSSVRAAIMRLREAGYIIRQSRGGYVVRVALPPGIVGEGRIEEFEELVNMIKDLGRKVEEISKRLSRLEAEVKALKATSIRKGGVEDELIRKLSEDKVVQIEVARRLAKGSLQSYIDSGQVVYISGYIVQKEFFEEFKRKFPIKLSEVKNLPEAEKILLQAMVREGMVYLYGGREYRLV